MTRDDARAYFDKKGLTYFDITRYDLLLLRVLLNKHFIRRREELIKNDKEECLYWRHVNQIEYSDGGFYLTARGEYFDDREVISFNRDGFIGFCGGSDRNNAQPVLDAFVEWCDWMAGEESEEEMARKKQNPMKVTDIHVDEFYCPACGGEVVGEPLYYCPLCGQKFEQEEEEEY